MVFFCWYWLLRLNCAKSLSRVGGAVRYHTTRYKTAWYRTVWLKTVRYNTVWSNTVMYNTVRNNMVQYNNVRYDTAYGTTPKGKTRHKYNTIRYATATRYGLYYKKQHSTAYGTTRSGTTRHIRYNTKYGTTRHGKKAIQYNTIPSTVQHDSSTVQHDSSTVQHGMPERYNTAYGTPRHGPTRYNTIRHDTVKASSFRPPLPGSGLPALLPLPRPRPLQAEGALGIRGAMDGAHSVCRHGALRSAALLVRGGE